jgi:hypothetical protein
MFSCRRSGEAISSDVMLANASGDISRFRIAVTRNGLFLSFKLNILDRMELLSVSEDCQEHNLPILIVCLIIMRLEYGLFYFLAEGFHLWGLAHSSTFLAITSVGLITATSRFEGVKNQSTRSISYRITGLNQIRRPFGYHMKRTHF